MATNPTIGCSAVGASVFIDSNIILRHIIGDEPVQAAACRELFRAVEAGRKSVWTTNQVVAECVYVLSKTYEVERARVAALLLRLIELPGVGLEQKRVIRHAFELFVAHPKVDYDDCYHAALVLARGETAVMSYDRHFDRITGIERVVPPAPAE